MKSICNLSSEASVQMKEGSESSSFLPLPPGEDIDMENQAVTIFLWKGGLKLVL